MARTAKLHLSIGLPGSAGERTQWNDTFGYVTAGAMIIETPASGEQAMDLTGATLEIGDHNMDKKHARTVRPLASSRIIIHNK